MPASDASGWLERLQRFVSRDLWSADRDARDIPERLRAFLQFCVVVGEAFVRGPLLLHASALTYVTALSLVPLLAVAISIVSAFIGDQDLAELAVEELVVEIPSAREQLLELIENVNFRGLGPLGAAFLLVTTVLAVRHAETALGQIWGVRHGRNWVRRFTDYLAVIVIAPFLTAVALSTATAFQAQPLVERLIQVPLFAQLYELGVRYAAVLVLWVAFSFLYWFLPNTAVRVRSAVLGGAVAAVLFSLAQALFVSLVVGSGRYSAVFGGFAALPLLLMWIYFSWVIFLLGGEVSFAWQNLARYRREAQADHASPAQREALCLQVSLEVARAFERGEPAPDAEQLAEMADAPVRIVRDLLECLAQAGVLVQLAGLEADREAGYHPARPLERIHVADVLGALRGSRETSRTRAPRSPARRAALDVLDELDRAQAKAGLDRSLRDLLEAETGSAARAPE